MNESGATAFECRDMARRIRSSGVVDLMRQELRSELIEYLEDTDLDDDEVGDIVDNLSVGDHYTNAILVEALTLLAEKKEAERGQIGDPQ